MFGTFWTFRLQEDSVVGSVGWNKLYLLSLLG